MLALIAGVSLGATWIAVATAESPLHADAPIQPMIVPVTATELIQRFGVGVAVENVEGQGVVSHLEGTLTGLEVQVGDIIESGDVMFRVDDRGVALSGGRTDAALVNATSLVITLVRLSAIPLGATLIGAGLVIRALAPSDS